MRRLLLACCAAVVVVAVGAAYASFGPPTTGEMAQASARLQETMAMVDEANGTVASMSELMTETLDGETVSQIKQALANRAAADEGLDDALSTLDSIERDLDPDTDAKAVEPLRTSIRERQNMLASGAIVMEAGVRAYEQMPTVKSIWKLLLDGHSALAAASNKLKKGTSSAVRKARAKDEHALSQYQQALDKIKALSQAAPNVDLSALWNYSSYQLNAAREAVAADNALLKNDTKAAQAHMAAYQKWTKKGTEGAAWLPSSADALVKKLYYSYGTDEMSVQDAERSYSAAAKAAKLSDDALADYRTSKGSQP